MIRRRWYRGFHAPHARIEQCLSQQFGFDLFDGNPLAPIKLGLPLPHCRHELDFPGDSVEGNVIGKLLEQVVNDSLVLMVRVCAWPCDNSSFGIL